jgi:hypothetical protein
MEEEEGSLRLFLVTCSCGQGSYVYDLFIDDVKANRIDCSCGKKGVPAAVREAKTSE